MAGQALSGAVSQAQAVSRVSSGLGRQSGRGWAVSRAVGLGCQLGCGWAVSRAVRGCQPARQLGCQPVRVACACAQSLYPIQVKSL